MQLKIEEKRGLFDFHFEGGSTEFSKELQQKIAVFRYVYGFCAPCLRGDGAIGDWLEIALYRFHGFENARHNPHCLPCFELFTLSVNEYLKRYPATIIID